MGYLNDLPAQTDLWDVIRARESTWDFILDDYIDFAAGGPASALNSIGIGDSSPAGPPSTGSIIAIVPEPGTASLLTLGFLGLALQGRRSRR